VADSDKVDSAAAGPAAEYTPDDGIAEETTPGLSSDVVSAGDDVDTAGARGQNVAPAADPLSGAKRLPKAAASILRMPIDRSISPPVSLQ